MRAALSSRLGFWLWVALLGAALGPKCGGGLASWVAFFDPLEDEILASEPVEILARAGRGVDDTTLTLVLGGVDLVAALGLTPPFSDEGGVVMVGADAVTVSGFTISTPSEEPHRVEASLSGLSAGPWTVEIRGDVPTKALVSSKTRDFTVVEFLTLEAADVPAAGLPGGAVATDTQGVLGNASLGQALAAPPIATLGGQTIRSGHVEVAEGLIAGGGS